MRMLMKSTHILTMNDIAEKIFEYLPEDGSKVSGGQIKKDLEISAKDFKAAKSFLKGKGVVEVGRGRGGTISRIASEIPEEKKLSKAEIMAMAREEKEAKSKAAKRAKRIRAEALSRHSDTFPDASDIIPTLSDHYVYLEVQDGAGHSKMYRESIHEYEG